MVKRLIDLTGAVLGLLLLAPLFALVALAIKLDSPGPVFFRQERVGRYGKPFRIYKFRTMTVGAPGSGPQITAAGDARVTRVGALLRRTKIDELAQLIDVLRGTMSLVGPRPEVPRYVAQYPADKRERLLSVRPGITDFASLRYRNEGEILARADDPERAYVEEVLPDKLRVAANAVEHSSLPADLHALGLTLRTVFVPQAPLRRLQRLMNHARFWIRIEARLAARMRADRWWALAVDGLIVWACWHITYLFRLGFERWQPGRPWYDDYVSWGVVLAYLVALEAVGARRTLWRYFSLDDLTRVARACIIAGVLSAAAVLMAQLVGVARAVLVLHPLFTLLALAGARMLVRMLWEHAHAAASSGGAPVQRAVVLGAGETARRLIAGLHQRQGWHVLFLLDDDPKLQGISIGGVPVLGSLDRVRDPSLTMGATHAIIAMSNEAMIARASAMAAESGLTVMVVPTAANLQPAGTKAA